MTCAFHARCLRCYHVLRSLTCSAVSVPCARCSLENCRMLVLKKFLANRLKVVCCSFVFLFVVFHHSHQDNVFGQAFAVRGNELYLSTKLSTLKVSRLVLGMFGDEDVSRRTGNRLICWSTRKNRKTRSFPTTSPSVRFSM